MDELLEYKKEIYNFISFYSNENEVFPEETYFEYVNDLLSGAGILDNAEYRTFRNTRKGIRIDGYSWNALEKTICVILVDFTNDPNVVTTLTNSQIIDMGKKATRFFESVGSVAFLQSLEVTDPGYSLATEVKSYLQDAIKFRVVVFTDQILSARVKRLVIEDILGVNTSIEVWDLDRLRALEQSGSEYEEFSVNVLDLGGGIRALPANISEHGFSTYLGVMPGKLLSAIYDMYGQRLLESNVRTFLDFRAGTNKGMRRTLLTEPEHFFAFNNGITVTATAIETTENGGQLLITSLENMQIVNGGQTTAAIYFSPREKGGIKGADRMYNYSEIDLQKVFVQMKLTVVNSKEKSDEMKSKIAIFANSQNSVQESDLVSNHPFHLSIETRSRKQLMPPGENGLSSKWFYERVRGQYSTQLRALNAVQKRKFEAEYPKKQVFSKTDMAKYENTWRMKPFLVKKGAQANLRLLGGEIIREFNSDESAFGVSFYNDLVAKILLFRSVDSAIIKEDWYKVESGLKAEMVTYSIALLRHALLNRNMDINLHAIYQNQKISESLLSTILSVARIIRAHVKDSVFTDGENNPSEFCKTEKGWNKVQSIRLDLSSLRGSDVLSGEEVLDVKKEKRELVQVEQVVSGFEYVMSVSPREWDLVAEYNANVYPHIHKSVDIPKKCAELHRSGRMLSDRQLNLAKEIREAAYKEGFDYVK